MNQVNLKIIGKIFVLLLTIFAFLFASNGPVQAEREKFVFGSAVAHTGKFAREGTNLKKAYDFWADMVNKIQDLHFNPVPGFGAGGVRLLHRGLVLEISRSI